MNFFKILVWLILLYQRPLRPKYPPKYCPKYLLVWFLGAGLWVLLGGGDAWAHAGHGDEGDLSSASTSSDLSGAELKPIWVNVAMGVLQAPQRLPSERAEGYLLQGDAGIDRRGTYLEFAQLGLQKAWHGALGQKYQGQMTVMTHDQDPVQLETVWWQWKSAPDLADSSGLQVRVGRQYPQLIQSASRQGRWNQFGLVPLAKQVTMNGDWLDEGVQWTWQSNSLPNTLTSTSTSTSTWRWDIGLWRGQVFPGSISNNRPSYSIRISKTDPQWAWDAWWVKFDAKERGSRTVQTLNTQAHSHSAPSCIQGATAEVACFNGVSRFAGTHLRFEAPRWPISLSTAIFGRQDEGDLSSLNGAAQYDGLQQGSWLEAAWRVNPRTSWAIRQENAKARHVLSGSGSSLLTSEIGLTHYQPARRQSMSLAYQSATWSAHTWYAEWGQETVAGARVPYVLGRWVWQW
jgi:hypothetical protein